MSTTISAPPAAVVKTSIAIAVTVLVLITAAWLDARQGIGFGGRHAAFALLIGVALGVIFQRGRFCFYCITRDLVEFGNSRGVYAILAALAVGTIGYAVVFSVRLPVPGGGDLPTGAHIAPVSIAVLLAGAVFGVGMVLSGGCVAGQLYRLGEGSIRARPALGGVLIGFGLGFASWNGIYATLIDGAPVPWLPAGGGYGLAVGLQLVVLGAIAWFLLPKNAPEEARPQRSVDLAEVRETVLVRRWPALVTGALVGLVGVAAYLRDRPLGVTSQLSSLSRTVLDERGLLPERLTGLDQTLGGCVALVVDTITANGWLVLGIVAGSFAAALAGGRFKFERLTPRQAGTGLLGGVLVGWASIIGLGCTVGVLLSGTQAMALSGWVFAIGFGVAAWGAFKLGLHRS